jgi:hypothetical protein
MRKGSMNLSYGAEHPFRIHEQQGYHQYYQQVTPIGRPVERSVIARDHIRTIFARVFSASLTVLDSGRSACLPGAACREMRGKQAA